MGADAALRGQEYEEVVLPPEAQAREMDEMKGWISETPHAPGPELAAALAAAAYVPPNSSTQGIVILNSGGPCLPGCLGTRAPRPAQGTCVQVSLQAQAPLSPQAGRLL